MTLTIETRPHPTQEGMTVETVTVATREELHELRNSEWVDDALRLLTYPSVTYGYLHYGGGTPLEVGDTLAKGPAGDFEIWKVRP